MRSTLALVLVLACRSSEDPEPPVAEEPEWATWCPADAREVDARVQAFVASLTLDEAAGLVAGVSLLPAADGLWRAPGLRELPELAMVDGPRGVHRATGPATAFPVGMARGATWDPALEEAVGEVMGTEARAKGAGMLLAPTVNVLRHPRWGRSQETYGEDPLLLAELGVGFVIGVQSTGVLASAKHFAANSIEDTRFDVDVQVDEAALREIYLPQFRALVDQAKVASVMSAYNGVNGSHSAENAYLLRDILKGEWGFAGFVESDWVFGTESTVASLEAGLDLEMPVGVYYGEALAEAVRAGEVGRDRLDAAVTRLARARWCFRLDSSPPVVDPSKVETAEHRELAREVAERSAVLLVNDGVIPVDRSASIALLGRLADVANLGDVGSSAVEPSVVVTPLDGLVAAGADVVHLPEWTADDPDALTAHDVAVVVVGLTAADEGEGFIAAGDRSSLRLRDEDLALIAEVTAVHPRTVVVLQGGGVVEVEDFVDEVAALWMAWYPGMEGGHALASLLLGDVAPAGRLPVVWPRSEADLPPFDNTSYEVTYDGWHGYRYLDRAGTEARFPFGFGLSTTTFALTDASSGDGAVTVEVLNTGARRGTATVQAYASAGGDAPVRELVGWVQLTLDPGERLQTSVPLHTDPIARWDGSALTVDPGVRQVELGWYAGDVQATVDWEVPADVE
ncbi:MAG: beta-glucosidase [Myxococcota bacterium]|jgi:beta-glucosidase